MKEFYEEIREIEEMVQDWTASDEGLTMAASDILAACAHTRKELGRLRGLSIKEMRDLQRDIEETPLGDPLIDDLEGIILRAIDKEMARRKETRVYYFWYDGRGLLAVNTSVEEAWEELRYFLKETPEVDGDDLIEGWTLWGKSPEELTPEERELVELAGISLENEEVAE